MANLAFTTTHFCVHIINIDIWLTVKCLIIYWVYGSLSPQTCVPARRPSGVWSNLPPDRGWFEYYHARRIIYQESTTSYVAWSALVFGILSHHLSCLLVYFQVQTCMLARQSGSFWKISPLILTLICPRSQTTYLQLFSVRILRIQ